MGRWEIILVLVTFGLAPAEVWSQPTQTIRYPRVYGATGRPYGPTQAHYQYQKQYGRPWHGYGGLSATIPANGGHHFAHGYPGSHLSYGGYGYNAYYNYGGCDLGYSGIIPSPGYPLFPSYTPGVPQVIYGYPPVLGYNPLNNPAPNLPPLDNAPLEMTPAPNKNPLPPLASSPEAKLKSLRAEAQGDMWFQKQEYHKAFDRYKTAVAEANDRGAAHLRLAVCYAALNHMDLAARQLKLGIAADPQLAVNADALSKIYGNGNQIAQSEMVHRAALWLKEDLRDPDRLFLLGALLHLQEDERAPILLKTGRAVQGGGDHFRQFLAVAETSPNQPADNQPADQAATGDSPPPQATDPNSSTPNSEEEPLLPNSSDPLSNDSKANSLPPGPALAPPRR